jgi:hypothetical protein
VNERVSLWSRTPPNPTTAASQGGEMHAVPRVRRKIA